MDASLNLEGGIHFYFNLHGIVHG